MQIKVSFEGFQMTMFQTFVIKAMSLMCFEPSSPCLERRIFNLFVTSKNETTNSPIHEFNVLHKGQRAFKKPFLIVYYFLFITLKNILSLALSFLRL